LFGFQQRKTTIQFQIQHTAPGLPGTSPAALPPPSLVPPSAPPFEPPREPATSYSATLVIVAAQVDVTLGRIEQLVRAAGGRLASRADATLVVRVPRARFDETTAAIAKMGDLVHREVHAEADDQVVDIELRLKNARGVRERLAQLLQGATATKDVLDLEKEIARVTGEIESMDGQLRAANERLAYSMITVSFQPLRASESRAAATLPFPWLADLGLRSLLDVSSTSLASTPGCTPPFAYDAQGLKHFKPECL